MGGTTCRTLFGIGAILFLVKACWVSSSAAPENEYGKSYEEESARDDKPINSLKEE